MPEQQNVSHDGWEHSIEPTERHQCRLPSFTVYIGVKGMLVMLV